MRARHPLRIALLAPCAIAGLLAQPAPAHAQPDARPLAPGRATRAHVGAPGDRRWTLELTAGDYAEVEVAQRGVDLTLRVRAPDDSLRASFDGAWALQGTERARWIADVAGRWTVELAPYPQRATGDYEIRWTVHRAASPADRALALADSLHQAGAALARRGRLADAEPPLGRALELRTRLLGDMHGDVGATLSELGALRFRQGRYADAEPLWRRALAVRERALGADDPMVGLSLSNLAVLLTRRGRFAEAEALHRRALAVREEALGPRHPDVAGSLQNIANLDVQLGRYADADSVLQRAIAILEATLGPDDARVAESVSNLAVVRDHQGRFAEAEPLYRRALATHERTLGPDHATTLLTAGNLGALYLGQRRWVEAETLLRHVLAASERTSGAEHPSVARHLENLALAYAGEPARLAEAEALVRRALAIRERAFGPAHPEVATALTNLAGLLRARGRHAESEALHRRALAIRETALGSAHPLVALSLTGAARSLVDLGGDQGDLSAARPLLDRAIAILDAARDADRGTAERGVADVLVTAYVLRATVRRRDGDRVGALADLATAIDHAEAQRPDVGGGEETRAAFFGGYAGHFDRMVAWQLEAGDLARALAYAERARARVLLDQLAASRVDVRQGIEPALRASLEARERSARTRVAEYQHRLAQLGAQPEEARDREGALMEDSLRAADRALRDASAELEAASPTWRALLGARPPVPIDTIQRRLVPARGWLLLYQIGDEASTLFAIPPAGATPHALPLRVEARDAAALGVPQGALTASALATATGPLARSLGTSPRAPGAAPPDSLLDRLLALRRVLVPDSLWARLRGAPEVVVVPGRGLYVLPFEALVVARGATVRRTRFWLDDGPAVRYAASATTLWDLERRDAGRRDVGAPSVLSVSNPTFEPADRVSPATVAPSATRAGFLRAGFLRAGGGLAPLPATAAETEAIRRAFGAPGGHAAVTALQGSAATEARLRDALAGKRYVHLATHAVVDAGRGAPFAALALAPPADGVPVPENDGFLQLHEVYGLHLAGVELAVLSACETSAGPAVDGEGVFALARGFHAAGARRVIGSEWAVEDRSTAALMRALFAGIAAAGRGGGAASHAAALRDAKRAVRGQARWAHPYYWAPFVLTGAR